jgi:hypothetical protein
VRPACRLSALVSAARSVARAMFRSRCCFQRAGSVSNWVPPGWSQVLGIDAVGGPPQCDFADEGGARVTSRWCPDWLRVTLAGVVLYLVGEVDDKLGSLCQVAGPHGIGMERWWNAREPGQRTWLGWGERCEAPVEDGRYIVCGSEVASGGGCQQWRSGCVPVSAAKAIRWARRVGQAGSSVSPGM